MSWQRPVGIVILALAILSFVLMAYGLVVWGPVALVLMVVWMALAVAGSLLIVHREKPVIEPKEVGPVDSVREAGLPEMGKKAESITFDGYCPRCGSPLPDGKDSCAVCGWRSP